MERRRRKKKKGKAKQNYHTLHSKMLARASEHVPTQGGAEWISKTLSSQYLELGDESKQVGQD